MGISSIIGPAFDGIAKLIAQFHMTPDEKAQLQAAHEKMQADLQTQAENYEVALNETASKNITADANSKDGYTERARPTFMYIVELILAFNYIVLPFLGLFNKSAKPIELPGDLLTLFGVCVTGYVCARSADKALGLPGNTSINVLGIKASNDGPGAK